MTPQDYYSLLDPGAKAWVSEQEEEVRLSIFLWIGCVLSALIIPAVVIFFFAQLTSSQPQWVQRGGTIVLVFAILAEIKAQAVRRNIFIVNSNRLYCHLYIEEKYKKLMPYVQYFTYLLIAVGTLITGYGDLVYQWLLQQC
jgi:general stress protein CsbA